MRLRLLSQLNLYFFFLFASLLISPFLRYRDAAPNELVLRVQPGNYSATAAAQNSFVDDF